MTRMLAAVSLVCRIASAGRKGAGTSSCPGPPPVKSQEPPAGTFTVTGPWAAHVYTTNNAKTIIKCRMRKEQQINVRVHNQANSFDAMSAAASSERYGFNTMKMWVSPFFRSIGPGSAGYFLCEKSIQ